MKPAYMGIASGYTIDLYCRNKDCKDPGYYFDRPQDQVSTDGPNCYYEARRMARRKGWKLHKDGSATCPYCQKKPSRPQQ